jgi:hypothetical protein
VVLINGWIVHPVKLETVQGESWSGLPDGILSNQKYLFGYILEGFRIDNVGISKGHLEYFIAIWYILWSFGNVVRN